MVLFLESKGYEVVPLNFSYGSKHNDRERKSAEMIFKITKSLNEANIEALDKAISLATDGRVSLLSPFQHEDKAAIVGLVKDLDGAQEILAKSYSCYEGGEVHCGICATCQERKRAFLESNTEDKTEYLQ